MIHDHVKSIIGKVKKSKQANEAREYALRIHILKQRKREKKPEAVIEDLLGTHMNVAIEIYTRKMQKHEKKLNKFNVVFFLCILWLFTTDFMIDFQFSTFWFIKSFSNISQWLRVFFLEFIWIFFAISFRRLFCFSILYMPLLARVHKQLISFCIHTKMTQSKCSAAGFAALSSMKRALRWPSLCLSTFTCLDRFYFIDHFDKTRDIIFILLFVPNAPLSQRHNCVPISRK